MRPTASSLLVLSALSLMTATLAGCGLGPTTELRVAYTVTELGQPPFSYPGGGCAGRPGPFAGTGSTEGLIALGFYEKVTTSYARSTAEVFWGSRRDTVFGGENVEEVVFDDAFFLDAQTIELEVTNLDGDQLVAKYTGSEDEPCR